MRKLLLTVLAAVTLMSCGGNHRSNVKKEVMEGLEEVMAQLNDTSFHSVVINPAGENAEIISSALPDSSGNIIVNINIPDEDADFDDGVPGFVAPVAIISVLGAFIAPVIAVFVICFFIYKTKRDRNRIIYESVVSGHTLPKEFYRIRPRKARFQSSVAWLAWSIGLFVFFMIVGWQEVAMLMLIPFIIGAGKMAAFFMYDYKKDNVD